jgi:3-methyladenine DNA glycosylase/8-oxoguanine DNA glycosylase
MEIPVQTPFPWREMLLYMSRRLIPGAEIVTGDQYRRGGIAVSYDASIEALRCALPHNADEADCRARLERLFDTRHDPAGAARVLARSPLLRDRVRRLPGLRVPGCWEPFELCLRVIVGQQVSVAASHTLLDRVAARYPGLKPDQLAEAGLDGLGLTRNRARTIRALAAKVSLREIRFEGQSWPKLASALAEIPGIGPWTLQYLALRLGRDRDAFPHTDLGLRKAAAAKTPADLLRAAESWRPYRGYAAMYLWMPLQSQR